MVRPLAELLRRLWRHFSVRRRRQFQLLVVLMVLASFAEMLSIGAVVPFLAVLTAPDRIFASAAARPIVEFLNVTSSEQLLLPLTAAFAIAALLAGAMRLLLLWASTRISFAAGSDLSNDIYRRTLYQPYPVHVARNSSEVINGIALKAIDVIYHTIVPALTILSSGLMLVAILVAMMLVDAAMTLVAFSGFGAIYLLITLLTRKRLMANSRSTARDSTLVIKSLQEGLGGIRDVLIDGRQQAFCAIYRVADERLRRAQGSTLFISSSPRLGMEALGMVVIAALALLLARQTEGLGRAIPVLGALGLGAQRLLPILQQLYSSWSSIRGGQVSLQDTLELLDQPLPDHADGPSAAPMVFRERIVLRSVWFRYGAGTPMVLKGIDLSIGKGSRTGFIGATGSGKSTLLDIIMGLLPPTEGSVEIDGQQITPSNHRAWQSHVAHVPQAIYLSDDTIEANIAFGVPEGQWDRGRIRWAAQQAQIADTVEAWPAKYRTMVGERGIQLSGGQRQRLGIARALYKQADVIVFDEATSALDTETEHAVMQAIGELDPDLTILVIAHRLSTLKDCTQVVELEQGRIVRSGSYRDLVANPVP
jgi:ABC-type multidrug transport system fused ATPase/permease subunit